MTAGPDGCKTCFVHLASTVAGGSPAPGLNLAWASWDPYCHVQANWALRPLRAKHNEGQEQTDRTDTNSEKHTDCVVGGMQTWSGEKQTEGEE